MPEPLTAQALCEHNWQYNKPARATASVRICATCHTIDGEDLMRTLNEYAHEQRLPGNPTGAVIEIIERGRTTDGTLAGSIITPDEVRINGQPLLIAADEPITIHEINVRSGDLVCVTLTLIARRVIIAAEDDLS